MKKIVLLFILATLAVSCVSRDTRNTSNYNKARVDEIEPYLYENVLEK